MSDILTLVRNILLETTFDKKMKFYQGPMIL
jgi:hypothetical protein